jgi:hypothetical protein
MTIDWIDWLGVLLLVWVGHSRFKKLEEDNQHLEIRCNTFEMNLKRLNFFRAVEDYQPDLTMSDEERNALKLQIDAEVAELAERNKYLMSQLRKN